MKSVAIIGGGITGLTAAYQLRRAGLEVAVFESSNRTGGVIRSVRNGDWLAECGPNTLMETTPVIGELIAALGLDDRLLHSAPEANKKFIIRDGAPVEVPESPPAFLTSGLFSAKAKLALFREPFIKPGTNPDESLADFVRRRLGQEFLDYAINPMVGGVYAGDPETLSVREAFPRVYELEQNYGSLIKGQIKGAKERKKRGAPSRKDAPKLSFDEGLDTLPRAISDTLGDSLYTGTPVRHLTHNGESWRLDTIDAAYDAVLLAMPAYALAELQVESATPVDLSTLSDVRHPPVASVVLGFRRDQVRHPLDGFGALVPEVENRQILGTIFSSTLFPYRVPKDHVLLTSYVGGTRSPDLARKSEAELIELTCRDLGDLYGIEGDPVFTHTSYYPRAIAQYNVGFAAYRKLLEESEQKLPGLFFAGQCKDGIALGDSIASGDRMAEKVSAYFSGGES